MDMNEPPMPMGNPEPPMGEPEPPMPEGDNMPTDGPEPPMDEAPKGEGSEIDSIFDKLDTEKQAAVIKYAKSMINDKGDDLEEGPEPPMDEAPEMELESKMNLNNLISEIVNNILSDEETDDDEDRRDDKIRNKKVKSSSPFIAKTSNI